MKFLFVSVCLILLVQINCLDEGLRAQSVLYGISSLAQDYNNQSVCYEQLNFLFDSVELHQAWALRAIDASGRPNSGFLHGNNLWIGSHSQCIDIGNTKLLEINYGKIKQPKPSPDDFPPFPLGFMMVLMKHNNTLQHHTHMPLDYTIQLGLCIPKACSSKELSALINIYLNHGYLNIQNLYDLHLEVTELKGLKESAGWMLLLPKTQIFLFICCLTFVLVIIGTIYDVRKHNRSKNLITGYNANIHSKETPTRVSELELVSNTSNEHRTSLSSKIGKILKCFSIYSNAKNLMKTKLTSDSVPVIHGLRFFGMLWVIMIHSVFYQADYLENTPFAFRLSEDIFAQILSNSTYAVDTYLFLSGFLVGYLFFKSKMKFISENEQINYLRKIIEFVMMCINRFLRLTPPYIIVILFTDVLFTYYRESTSLHQSEYPDVVCSKYWWRNILYINNLYPRSEMCLSWSWYLSIDTQFFTITTFLLILSTITFKVSAGIIILLIVINVITTTYKSYIIGYIPTMDQQLSQLDAIYDLPWMRIGPYLIGVITAYILVVKLQKQLYLKERTRIFLWIVFPLLNLWILFTLYTRQLSVEFSAVYMGTSRTLWGIGLGWLLIACCTGNARALEKFLSFPGWIPLSRLTYCAYLLNPIVANMIYSCSETTYNASIATFTLISTGVTLLTFNLSFVFSMLFESPFILLTKMLIKQLKGKRHDKAGNEQGA